MRGGLPQWSIFVGENAVPQMSPVPRVCLGTIARYLPGRSFACALKLPFPAVVACVKKCQPAEKRWISTWTPLLHAANASATVTVPVNWSGWWIVSVTCRACDTLKFVALLAVPPAVVTATRPAEAPEGTVVVICVGEFTVNAAGTPLNLTAVAPVRFVPVMTTEVPAGPLVGANDVIVGGGTTVKTTALVAVPPAVVTVIEPVTAAKGTVAVIWVAEFTTKVAKKPANFTAVAPVKFVPVMTTEVPTGPLVGVKNVIVGAGIAVKVAALVAVPPAVVTVIEPVTAPVGTVAVIWVAESITKVVAAVPPNFTDVAPVKFVPVMTTNVPGPPVVGVKLVIVGAGTTVKTAPVAVPPGFVTAMGPVVALAGTTVVIVVFVEGVKKADAEPLNVTAVAPRKFVPVIVTVVPIPPLVGVKEVIVGGSEKLVALVAVIPAAVTAIGPEVAPAGTVVVMVVEEFVPITAGVPLKVTLVAPERFSPVIVTAVPTAPPAGENDVIVGPTVNVAALVPVPDALVAAIEPVSAPEGTVAVIDVSEFTVKEVAETPPNVTDVTTGVMKFVPVIATEVPTGPLLGTNPVTVGVNAKAGIASSGTSRKAMMRAPETRSPRCRMRTVMACVPRFRLGSRIV